MTATPGLPPGQRPAEHRPFGLPRFGPVVPHLSFPPEHGHPT
jgi:hypothetical protein